MPFGKHKGIKMANVPAQYLLWAKDAWRRGPGTNAILDYIEENLQAIKQEYDKDQKDKKSSPLYPK